MPYATFWHWLVSSGHLYVALVSWCVGAIMTGGAIGLVIRPTCRRVRTAWAEHIAAQHQIADRLDPRTVGGLGDLDLPIRPPAGHATRSES